MMKHVHIFPLWEFVYRYNFVFQQKTVLNNGGPTKPKRDSNDKRDGDDNASSSRVSQQAAISETREQGNSPQNSRALPEGIQEPSTDGAAVSDETLGGC